MPDISMCDNPMCLRSKMCKRHPDSGTKPSDWQSWAAYGSLKSGHTGVSWPTEKIDGCDAYWPWKMDELK